jgi:hypothetical protein
MAPANTTTGGNAAFHNFNNDFAHIQDPNERRRLALAEIDKAPFGWYHVRGKHLIPQTLQTLQKAAALKHESWSVALVFTETASNDS